MIGRKVILAFGVNMLKQGLGFLGLFFVARYMGATALGIIGFGFAYVGIFAFLSDMGFAAAHVKRVSEGKDLPKCIGTYLWIRSGLTGAMVIAVVISILALKYVMRNNFASPEHEYVVYVALLTAILSSFSNVASQTFAAKTETAKQKVPEIMGKIVEVAVKIIVAVAGLGVVMLAGASFVAGVIMFLCFAWLFRSYTIGKTDLASVKDYSIFAIPVMVIVSANAVTENLDKLMIQFFYGSRELGFYEGGARIATVFMFMATAVGTLFFPIISAYHSKNDIHSIQEMTHRVERYLSMMLLPIGILLIFFGSEIAVLLLGKEFLSAGPILSLKSCAMIIFTLSVLYSSHIIGTNRVKLAAALTVVLMSLNVSLNLVFIPKRVLGIQLLGLGAYGAAWATLISIFLMALIYRYYAYKITGTKINIRLLKQLVASMAMAIATYLLKGTFGNSEILSALNIIFPCLLIYTLSLISLRELSKSDCAYLLELFSPFRMRSYVSEEFGLRSSGEAKRIKEVRVDE